MKKPIFCHSCVIWGGYSFILILVWISVWIFGFGSIEAISSLILRYPLSSSPAVGRVFWIHFGLVRFSLSSRDLSWFLAFLTLSASSGFLRQLLCLQCEFLLHASKGYRPESRPKLCLVARLPRCSRCSFLRFVWLPLVSSSSILSSTCSFLGRTDRVPSCSSSSSTSLLDLSVETLLPPRAGHPARSSSCCI
jgi:hypothetical protein